MTTETDRQELTKPSSRQPGAAEQTRRVEAGLRARRRRRALAAAGVFVVAFAVAGAAILYFSRPGVAAQGRQVPIEGDRQHVAQGADVAYRNRPPSPGDHYPTPAGYGVFTRDIPLGNLVHALEHGGIVVYYRPDLCDQGCQDQLRQAYNSAPRSRQYGVVKMVVAPWQDMDHAVTSAAWRWVDMDQADSERIVAFYRAHVDRGPEDAL